MGKREHAPHVDNLTQQKNDQQDILNLDFVHCTLQGRFDATGVGKLHKVYHRISKVRMGEGP